MVNRNTAVYFFLAYRINLIFYCGNEPFIVNALTRNTHILSIFVYLQELMINQKRKS